MIQRPERRAHERQSAEEQVTVSGTDRNGLVVVRGTIVDTSPGGLRIDLEAESGLDPEFVPDAVLTRAAGRTRHLVLRLLAVEGRTLRATFVDPPTVDPAEWER